MNPNKQRIAIAEACGWSQIEDFSKSVMMPVGTVLRGYPPGAIIVRRKVELPDFLHDLNTTHEAEKTLILGLMFNYTDTLERLVHNDVPGAYPFSMVHATAAQRAEAFLKTIGKWEDT